MDTRIQFDQAIQQNLNREEFDQSNPAESWRNLRTSVNDAASSVLPKKKTLPLRKRYVSVHTKQLYSERQKNSPNLSTAERKAASNEITRSIREDYISYLNGILADMEKADRTSNTRELKRLTCLLSGK